MFNDIYIYSVYQEVKLKLEDLYHNQKLYIVILYI